MSDDVISWYIFKGIDLRKNLDQDLANFEKLERSLVEINKVLELTTDGVTKDVLIMLLDILMAFKESQRTQIIWINSLKEGLIQIEERLDNL